MTRIDIHIGTHKTASTTIQEALAKTLDENTHEGWAYLPFWKLNSPKLMTSLNHDQQIANELGSRINRAIGESLAHAEVGIERFVTSWEGFSGNPRLAYQNANAVASMLRESTKSLDVRIIVYLRRQDEFVESMYTQTIHEGGSESFQNFLAEFNAAGPLDYDVFLSNYATYFGADQMVVRSYHAASGRGIVSDFGATIESPRLHSWAEANRSNQSYSRTALELARVVNPKLTAQQRKKLRRVLQKVSPKRPGDSFQYFDADKRAEYLEKLLESNLVVAKKYLRGNLEELFPTDFDVVPPRQAADSMDDLAKVVVELLNSDNQLPSEQTTKNESLNDKLVHRVKRPNWGKRLRKWIGKRYQ